MKILYLLYSFSIGGTERLVSDICNEMAQRGNDIYLYIVNNIVSEELIGNLDAKVVVYTQNRQPGGNDRVKTLKKISDYIEKQDIELVHCNSFYSPELLIWAKIKHPSLKIVHTIHDVGQYKELSKLKILYRNIVCDQFIAISKSVKQDIIEKGATEQKVKIVYNAINLERFNKINDRSPNKDQIVLCNVARFMPEKKGQDILLEAVRILKEKYPDIICIFAGSSDNHHLNAFETFKEKIKKYDLCCNIKLLGNVNDIPKLLQEVDIFVLPSRFEGFGISLIEAMALGIPCIASDLDGPAEILGNNEKYLFTVNDYRQLAEKISQIIDNISIEKIAAVEKTESVRKFYDIKAMCDNLEKIYISTYKSEFF